MSKRTKEVRKNLLPVLLAVAGLFAGGSMGHAAATANIDFSSASGYNTATASLVGQDGWLAYGATLKTTSPVKVTPDGAVLAAVAGQSVYKQYNPYQFTDAKGRVFVRLDIKVTAASVAGTDFFIIHRELDNTVGNTFGQIGGKRYFRTYIKSQGTGYVIGWNPNDATGITYDTTERAFGQTYTILIRYDAISGTTANDVSYIMVDPNWNADTTSLPWISALTRSDWIGGALNEFSSSLSSGGTPARSPGYLGFALKQSASHALTVRKIALGDTLGDVGILPSAPPNAPTSSAATSPGTGGFTANWTADSNAAGYYLDVATDSGFTSFVAGYNGKDVGAVVFSSVTGSFTAGTTLYYRVRAYNPAGSSTDSATQEVVITAAPVVSVPTVTNSATSGTVTWTSGPDWIPNNPVSASNATVTFNGVLNGVLTANNDTASPFVLNSLVFANSSGAGTNDITGGVLQLTNNGTTNPTITFINNTTYQRVSAPIQLDTNVTVSQSGSTASNSILAGVVSGGGGLTKSGGGYVYLTQINNSFGGPVTIGNGTLVPENIGLAGQNSSLGTNGAITLGGGSLTGTLRWGSGSVTNEATDKTFALPGSTGGGTIDVRGTNSLLTLNGAIDTGANAALRNFTLTGQGGATVNGLMSGNGGLRVNGSDNRTVILANGNNSFGGAVTLDGNITNKSYKLQVASIGNAGSNSPLGTNGTINIGSTVSGSYNFLVWTNTVPETTDKTINLAGAAGGHALINNKGPALLKFTTGLTATGAGAKTLYADQDDANGVTEFAAAIPDSSLGGATAMNKNGAGTLILSAANTFTGGFTLKGGTLELKHAQSLAVGNVLTFPNSGTGSGRVKVAYTGVGSDLGNLTLGADATIDLGTDSTTEIRFSSATGWTAAKILTVANSTGGGKMYILSPAGVDLAQIKSLENPTWPASLDTNGLLTFTNPAPANTLPVISSSQSFSVNENVSLATVVGTVVATDADANSTLSGWTIVSGNTGGVFAINAATGQITVAGTLNYEGTPSYSLGVTVSDGTATSAVGTVVVTVTNVAEYSDVFGSSSPTADDNGDGISNLMAYALGAMSPSSVVLPPALNTADPTKLTITALIRINDPKLNVVGEYGTTLGTWEMASPITGTDSSDQTGALAGVTKNKDFSVSRGTDSKKFLHLKATQTQ